MAITTLGAFRYICLDADVPNLPLNIEAGAIADAYDTQRKFVFDGSAWSEFEGIVPGDTIILNGQSTDTKPTVDIPLGSRFVENDTGKTYFFDGIVWTYESIDDESTNFNALKPRSSFVQLFGDTFGVRAASAVYLLEDNDDTSPTAGTALTENPAAITRNKDPDLPLRGFEVPTLNGTTEYFSLPTEPKVEMGVGSFVASIQFRAIKQDATQYIYSYGDINVSEQHWSLRVDAGNTIAMVIDDGTTTATATTSEPLRYHDGELHTATTIWQPTVGVFLFIDGELVASDTTGLPTLTLNNVGTFLNIGTRRNAGTASQFFQGELSNFQLYPADSVDATVPPDYNLPAILFAGIRESARQGVGDVLSTTDVSARIGNLFTNNQTSDADGDYETTVINVSEGFYDLNELWVDAGTRGEATISIDGQVISVTNQNGSVLWNQQKVTSGIFLSAGTHILKTETSGDGTGSGTFVHGYQMIELIKRDGNNEGDDEATSGVFFGDEISQRVNNTFFVKQARSVAVYNNRYGFLSSVTSEDGFFFEGDLFLKKGLYKITVTYQESTNNADLTMTWGGVKVLDKLDTSGAGSETNQATRFAFLEGGKTTVQCLADGNTGGADFNLQLNSIRFELVTGKSNEAEVNIWGSDADFENVVGTWDNLTVITNRRFQQSRQQDIQADLNEIQWSRYFSGGTYAVTLLAGENTDRPIIDIFSDDNSASPDIFNQLNLDGVNNVNALNFTTVTLARGFHDIHLKINGTTSASFNITYDRLLFTKIATVEQENDDNSDSVHGALVPLAKYRAVTPESSIFFDLGGVDRDKFSEVRIIIAGTNTDATSLQFRMNGIVTGSYNQQTLTTVGALSTGLNSTPSSVFLITEADMMNAANQRFQVEFLIRPDPHTNDARWAGLFSGGTILGMRDGMWTLVTGVFQNVDQVNIFMDNSTWAVNTRIDIYGVKK